MFHFRAVELHTQRIVVCAISEGKWSFCHSVEQNQQLHRHTSLPWNDLTQCHKFDSQLHSWSSPGEIPDCPNDQDADILKNQQFHCMLEQAYLPWSTSHTARSIDNVLSCFPKFSSSDLGSLPTAPWLFAVLTCRSSQILGQQQQRGLDRNFPHLYNCYDLSLTRRHVV